MQIHLALYDPSFLGSNRSYWTWSSSIIPDRLLDECYYRFLIKQKPEKPEQIHKNDLFGGIIELQNWVVVYRFYNGGRDLRDRPGRYVILTGWIKRNETLHRAPSKIFSSAVFESFAWNAPQCPVPQPDSLDIDVSGTPVKRPSIAIQPFDGKYVFPMNASVESAVESFFSLNSQSDKRHLTINKTDNLSHLAIEIVNAKTHSRLQSPDQQEPPFERQFNSPAPEQSNDSDYLFPEEDNMKYQQISLFNTCALIFIIIFLSVLFVQQISIQKQINNNSEVINTIQQELKLLQPQQNDFYYNPIQQPQDGVYSGAVPQEQTWDHTLESPEAGYLQTAPQNIQSPNPSDPNDPSTMSLPGGNESTPEQPSKKEKKKKQGSWNLLLQ